MITGRTRHVVFFAAEAGAGAAAGAAGADAAAGAGAAGASAAAAAAAAAGGAAAAPSFADTLPEDIRAEAVFKDIKNLEGLARGFHGQAKLLGVPKDQLIRVPGADADEKALGEVYTRLGRPESAEKYALKPPEGQQFSDADKAFHAAMLPAIHKAGLNQRQLDTVIGAWNAYAAKIVGEQDTASATALAAQFTALKTEWGPAAYENRVTRAGDALEYLATAAKVDLGAVKGELDRSGLAARPALLKLFDHVGAQLEEDGTLKGRGGGGGDGMMTPTEAKQQIAGLKEDAAFQKAWLTKDHPGHADAVQKRAKLYEIAYPAGA